MRGFDAHALGPVLPLCPLPIQNSAPMSIVELTDGQIFAADVRDGDHGNVTPQNDGGEQIKTFRVLITGFGVSAPLLSLYIPYPSPILCML